ncbi:MAG: pilus assembly protein [Xanthobacteraceae bacterium]|nr:MAG: pilus assembly protein [Xanthobacteraceae bacterium]
MKFSGCRTFRAFRRDQNGATAVEFALVVTPFLALLFAIIESAIVFFASQVLETAAQDSARMIMTGQVQAANFTAAQFKDNVCSRIYGLFDCANGVYVDVKSYSAFSNVSITNPVDGNKNFVNNFTYQPGSAGDIVVMRLFYQYPVFVSLMGYNLADINGGYRLISATVAFRNEPF